MCGILGVRRDRVERAVALQALRRMAWRGADELRLIACGDWWLGVARLAISGPESPQPIVDEETGCAIAFNGAVTDARRQRADLAARGQELQGGNDAELVLRRYLREGPESLDDQTGGYAFAVVDPRGDAVLLAVDPLGEKPLYVAEQSRLEAFASSPSALEELGFATKLASRKRAQLLRYGAVRSVAARDRKLRCAGLAPAVYRADPSSDQKAVWIGKSRGAAVVPQGEPIERALQRAVMRCADAEVPVGLCLSGGIDSACIAACLHDLGRRDIVGYQFRARGTSDAERLRARSVAERFGMRLVEVDGGSSVLDVLPGLIHGHGLPLGDPSVLAVHALARRASVDGVRVLLSGEGADDLLLGYPRHRAARRLPSAGFSALPAPRYGMGHLARLLRAWKSSRTFDALLEVTSPAFRTAVLKPVFGDLDRPLEEAGAFAGRCDQSALSRAQDLERSWYLYADLLPKLDVATLSAGIEGRCPFLDPEVVFSAAATEPDLRKMVGKRALRDAFRDRLPPGHMDQPKRGFGVPLAAWLRDSSWALPLLGDDTTLGREWVDPDGLRAWLAGFRDAGPRQSADARGLYLLLALELYERRLAAPPRGERAG